MNTISVGIERTMLYHITTAEAAQQAVHAGRYVPEGFAREGFIHCSYAHQVAGVARRFFKGQSNLVVFEIDRDRVQHRIVDENLEGGAELFPHIYGPLDMAAVVAIRPLPGPGHEARQAKASGPLEGSAAKAKAGASRCSVNSGFNRAILSFSDGSDLHFEHTRERRWAKASEAGTLADEVCLSLRLFRLNAKHLQLFFEDGSDAEFLPPFSTAPGLT